MKSEVERSLALIVAASLAEIGGGWLVWQWLRERKPLWVGLAGGAVLVLYGVIPTLQQEAAFGRVYAAYGGIFIVLAPTASAIIWWPRQMPKVGVPESMIARIVGTA